MKMKAISVSAPLIPGILEDRKLMTRRLIRPQPLGIIAGPRGDGAAKYVLEESPWQVGDILYVKEEHYAYGYWMEVEGGFTKMGKPKWAFLSEILPINGRLWPGQLYYSEVPPPARQIIRGISTVQGYYKRLARFMPKAYARIFLEVVEVRVEPLQHITPEDAMLEGREQHRSGAKSMTSAGIDWRTYLDSCIPWFKGIWEKINGPGSWEANPWVWVIRFKRVAKPEEN